MSKYSPTEFEALKVLHKAWKTNSLSFMDIRHVLLVDYNLKLLKVHEDIITAESLDGRSKYLVG